MRKRLTLLSLLWLNDFFFLFISEDMNMFKFTFHIHLWAYFQSEKSFLWSLNIEYGQIIAFSSWFTKMENSIIPFIHSCLVTMVDGKALSLYVIIVVIKFNMHKYVYKHLKKNIFRVYTNECSKSIYGRRINNFSQINKKTIWRQRERAREIEKPEEDREREFNSTCKSMKRKYLGAVNIC